MTKRHSGTSGISRRGFLGNVGAGTAASILTARTTSAQEGDTPARAPTHLPAGKPLRVQPVLSHDLPQRREKSSWRSYGEIFSPEAARQEAQRIETELKALADRAEFPLDVLPVLIATNDAAVREAADTDADVLLPYAAGGAVEWYWTLANSGIPNVMFLRHKSGPYYLYHEIAHWRVLRHHEDAMAEPNLDVWDVVVDDYDEMLWRLRALYGLKNAKGTKMLAVGSLAAYSGPAQKNGPKHAKDVWGYEIDIVSRESYQKRLDAVRNDAARMAIIEKDTAAFLARPKLTLATERKFVLNSFVAWHVCRDLLEENNAFNFGFDHCMGHEVISMLDTPPCLVLALANDAGYTAYCHTDLSHTTPGVLLRWITGQPTFLCNTHFPHDGIYTVAHCAAPMRMDGRDYEPATIMTHYESDYGAACKVEYPQGQVVTVVQPDLHCTRWHGFKGTVSASPSLPMCRSQMDIQIQGDWRRLTENMEGFHAQVVYGDYLREVGYALKKLGTLEWCNYSTY